MAEEITFYDIPSIPPCRSGSTNTVRTRLILNYKRLPYKTVWLEFPDIEPTLKSLDIPPNAEGTPYTCPTTKLPDGRYVMDSLAIARELQHLYPEPSLHLESPLLEEVLEVVSSVSKALFAVTIPKLARNALLPRSKEYIERTRSARFGMSLDQLEKEKGGPEAFEAAKPGLKKAADMLKANGGPFLLGKGPIYADFILVGALTMLERAGEGTFEKVVSIEPVLGALWEASKTLMERDDH